jgi:hypothetical protein
VILWPIRPGPSGAIPPPQGKLATINQWAADELAVIRNRHRATTEARAGVFADVPAVLEDVAFDAEAGRVVKQVVGPA